MLKAFAHEILEKLEGIILSSLNIDGVYPGLGLLPFSLLGKAPDVNLLGYDGFRE